MNGYSALMAVAAARRIDFEELVRCAHWGGVLGLIILVPSSCLLTLVSLFGESVAFQLATTAQLTMLVRLGIQVFLMGGWGFAAVSLVRQFVTPLFGKVTGALVGGGGGTLVLNLMAVIFGALMNDAAPVLWVAVLGLPTTTAVGLRMALGGPLDRKALRPGSRR